MKRLGVSLSTYYDNLRQSDDEERVALLPTTTIIVIQLLQRLRDPRHAVSHSQALFEAISLAIPDIFHFITDLIDDLEFLRNLKHHNEGTRSDEGGLRALAWRLRLWQRRIVSELQIHLARYNYESDG